MLSVVCKKWSRVIVSSLPLPLSVSPSLALSFLPLFPPFVLLLYIPFLTLLSCLSSISHIFLSFLSHFRLYHCFLPSFFFLFPSLFFIPLVSPTFQPCFKLLLYVSPLPLSIISLAVSHFPPNCFFPTPSSLLHYSDVHLFFFFPPSSSSAFLQETIGK